METKPKTVWDLYENPPKGAEETSALAEWSLNYDYKTGNPYWVFLDLIGYSEENYGENLFSGKFSQVLGFMELDYLADALKEYAENPTLVLAFIAQLQEVEMRNN
jgi:hypothetical protein